MAGLTTRLANEPHRLPAPQQRQTNGNAVGLGVQRAGMRRWAERSEHAIVHWIEDLARQVHGAAWLAQGPREPEALFRRDRQIHGCARACSRTHRGRRCTSLVHQNLVPQVSHVFSLLLTVVERSIMRRKAGSPQDHS